MTQEIKPTAPADTKLSTTMPSEQQQKHTQEKKKPKETVKDESEKTTKQPKKGLFDEFV